MPSTDPQIMQCMEVWGGNQPADSGVVMAGLDAWVYCKPFGDASAGGDVYYVSSCATGRITRLLVADVSGHGAAVCDVAGQLRVLMRRFVNHIDQTRFVRSMNEQFAANSKSGCFATAIVTTFWGPTNELSLCNAGHPPPLLYRARTGQWSLLDQERREDEAASNIPLGIDGITDYCEFTARLRVGDLVLCHTNALTESRDKGGNLLGEAGLLEVMKSLDATDAPNLIPSLLSAVAARAGGEISGDDLTILLFRPNGLGARVSFTKRLLAPFRLVGAVIGSLGSGSGPIPWSELSFTNVGGRLLAPLDEVLRRRKRAATRQVPD